MAPIGGRTLYDLTFSLSPTLFKSLLQSQVLAFPILQLLTRTLILWHVTAASHYEVLCNIRSSRACLVCDR